jgi:nucleoid-associated protein YgaU
MVKETLNDLSNLSADDTTYVEALNQLKDKENTSNTSISETAAAHVVKQGDNKDSVDYFNKVDVSKKNRQQTEDTLSLAKQIEGVVAAEEAASHDNFSPNKAEDNYYQTLDTASATRANEMRTIKVVRGDTLWSIARRAYGSGFEYGKIYAANPYLSNPDRIEVGNTLRVPI